MEFVAANWYLWFVGLLVCFLVGFIGILITESTVFMYFWIPGIIFWVLFLLSILIIFARFLITEFSVHIHLTLLSLP